jgi:hypothetical protein
MVPFLVVDADIIEGSRPGVGRQLLPLIDAVSNIIKIDKKKSPKLKTKNTLKPKFVPPQPLSR